MALRGINHIVLKVRDLHISDRFYQGLLGMRLVGERPGMWFYSAGAHHHDLALVEVGAQAPMPPAQAIGVFHICFDVSDEKALAEIYKRCEETPDIKILGTVDHTMTRSFYMADPDGYIIELGVDVPREEWEHLSDPFEQDRPYLIKT